MARDGCVTLARAPGAPAKWRASPFDRLMGWNWRQRCAFGSVADEKRVQAYLRDTRPGLEALAGAQHAAPGRGRLHGRYTRRQGRLPL